MKKLLVILLIPILIISGLYIILPTIPHAQAAFIGQVCIAKTGSTSCPLTPPLLNSTLPPAPQLKVAVVVNSSAALNGFDITLLTNSSFLKPAGYTFTNAIVAWSTLLAHCIGDVGGSGAGCTTTDTVNTLHIAAASQSSTFPPTTGLIFTAIYNVTGATFNSPISFQTGCQNTSVTGGICVTIANGSTGDDPETIQTAKFSNRPYFDFQPEFGVASLTDPIGTIDTSLILNATSVNGYSGTVTLAVTLVPAQPLITVAFSRNPLKVNTTTTPDSSQATVTVSASAPPGNYVLNFTATGTGSPTPPPNILLIPLIVPPPDYSITPSLGTPSNPLNFNVSSIGQSQITLTSLNNFAGRVNLTVTAPAGISGRLQTASLIVPKGGTVSTTLSLNTTIAGSYAVNITGVSTGLTPHTVTLSVNAFDFAMTTTAGTLVMGQHRSLPKTIIVSAIHNAPFAVNVTISNIFVDNVTADGHFAASNGLSVSCTPSTVDITVTAGSSTPSNTQCNVFGNLPGNYTVTVVGGSGKLSHVVTFLVIVTGLDFAMSTPAIVTVDQGKSTTANLFITSENGLVSNVTGFASTLTGPGGPFPVASFSVQSLPLTPASPNGTVIITIKASPSTPIGSYTVTISALATVTSQTHSISFFVVVTSTASPHDLAVLYVTPSSTSATVGSKIDITIEVANLGKVSDSSTVLALAGSITVGRVNVTLAPGQNMNVTMTWDTTGYSPGAYMIGGQVLGVSGETNLDNNLKINQTPLTLNAANSSVFSSPYIAPSIIAAIVVIVAIIGILLLQSRRKTEQAGKP